MPPSPSPSHAAAPSAAATSPDPSSSQNPKANKKKNKSKSKPDTTNGPAASDEPNTTHAPTDRDTPSKSKKKTGVKTMWVTIFKCFHCGKRGHDLIKCLQCEEAYYCDKKCQEAHATAHAKVCIATVTAKAQRAHRERLARAVRERGSDNVEGG